MTTIRRIYAYLLAFFGLAMFTVAAANLAQLLIDVILPSSRATSGSLIRDSVSLYAAGALVGLPAWLLHWLWIDRTARSSEAERASVLRRLYLYAVLAGALLIMARSADQVLARVVDALTGARASEFLLDDLLRLLPFAAIAAGVWWAHLRVAANDRLLVGEPGGSATLRRWYTYGAAGVGLLVLLQGSQSLLETIWRSVAESAGLAAAGAAGLAVGSGGGAAGSGGQAGGGFGGPAGAALSGPIAAALVGLAVWLTHWVVLPARLPEAARRDDGVSALRRVYLFLTLAGAVIGTLLGTSQLLYYAVARLIGVADPGGVGGSIVLAAAGPASFVIVYGAAWAYQRTAIRQQAALYGEAPRQAGVRRLYAYLVALVALGVLATGVAGLLWTLGDLVFNPAATASSDTWREQIALFATLAAVGLPAWLLHWRASAGDAAEAHSLARRLYVYLSLIVAALLGIGSLAAALYRLIRLALGESFDLGVSTDLAHALAVASVAAVLGAYHWRILRADAREAQPATPSGMLVSAVVEVCAADAASLARALDVLRATGVNVHVVSPPPAVSAPAVA